MMTNREYMFMVVYQFKFWREKFKIVEPEPTKMTKSRYNNSTLVKVGSLYLASKYCVSFIKDIHFFTIC